MYALRVVVLISGTGTLLQALLDGALTQGCYEVVAVGADRRSTVGERRAQERGIPTFVCALEDHASRAVWDQTLADLLDAHRPDLVVLAGFMKLLGEPSLSRFRIINTHPALLPSFPGAHGVRDALAYGVKVTGCSCIWVDDGVDSGAIIDQRAVRVEEGDDEATLHERIKVQERAMLLDVVRGLATDR